MRRLMILLTILIGLCNACNYYSGGDKSNLKNQNSSLRSTDSVLSFDFCMLGSKLKYDTFNDYSLTSANSTNDNIINENYLIDSICQLYLLRRGYFKRDTYLHMDTIRIFNKYFSVNEMLKIANPGKSKEEYDLEYIYGGATKLGVKKYLFLFFASRLFNSSTTHSFIFLFDITIKESISYIPIGFQSAVDFKAFGDFNSDGKLDFANVNFFSPSTAHQNMYDLKLLSLDTEKFVFTPTTYYMVISEDHGVYYIKRSSTNWPCELVVPCK